MTNSGNINAQDIRTDNDAQAGILATNNAVVNMGTILMDEVHDATVEINTHNTATGQLKASDTGSEINLGRVELKNIQGGKVSVIAENNVAGITATGASKVSVGSTTIGSD